jgi:hypothetical protein
MRFLRYFVLLGAMVVPAAFLTTPAQAQIGVGRCWLRGLWIQLSRAGLLLGLLQLLSLRLRPVRLLRT